MARAVLVAISLAAATAPALASQGPGGGPGTASSFTQLAMAVMVYGSCALLVGIALIGPRAGARFSRGASNSSCGARSRFRSAGIPVRKWRYNPAPRSAGIVAGIDPIGFQTRIDRQPPQRPSNPVLHGRRIVGRRLGCASRIADARSGRRHRRPAAP